VNLSPTCLALAAFAALVSACSGYCGGKESTETRIWDAAGPPVLPVTRTAERAIASPPPAPAPIATVGSGAVISYPERVPLQLAAGVEVLDPPMSVRMLLPIPDRRLAAASGKVASGPAVELIDVENATILWRDTEACSGPIVHATADRVVCAGWKGTVALNVDSGREAWRSPSMFRAAGAGYVVIRDATQVTVGEILDIATGRTVTRIQMPEGYDLEEVSHLCADATGFELFSSSPAGEVRRFRLGLREEIAYLAWVRRLRAQPSRLDPCDAVVLVETPIAGRSQRQLRALGKKKGIPLGSALDVYGWWSAHSPGDIEVVTDDGLELRDRRLGNIRSRTDRRVGDERIASWAGTHMIRSVDGTALLLGENGISHWLAAPVYAAQAVITPTHVLAGPWRGRRHSGAENLALYRLPAGRVQSFEAAPAPAPAPAPLTSATLERMPKSETSATATSKFPHAGEYAIARVALAGAALYIAADKSPPRPGQGAGITVFDLRARAFGWYQESACAANAEVVGIAITEHAIVCAAREHFPGPGVLSAVAVDSGAPMWSRKLATVDDVIGAAGTIVATVGTRAVVIDADSGVISYEILADNGHLPRVALTGGRVIAVEPKGWVVAREPDGTPVWSVAVRGYVRDLRPLTGAVAVHTNAGELFLINAESGDARAVDSQSRQWKASGGGDLAFDSARGRQGEFILWAYDVKGRERFRTSYPTIIEWDPAPLRSPDPEAPVVLVSRQGEPRLLQIDPRSGKVISRHLAPADTYRDGVFSAHVDGQGLAGVVLGDELAVQVYKQP
jgi:outer membrane protein assembly factor BamB